MLANELHNIAKKALTEPLDYELNALLNEIKDAANSGKFRLHKSGLRPELYTILELEGFEIKYLGLKTFILWEKPVCAQKEGD